MFNASMMNFLVTVWYMIIIRCYCLDLKDFLLLARSKQRSRWGTYNERNGLKDRNGQ